jgi:AcrR family transcriptional regulator
MSRRYVQRARAEAARQTRGQVLEAARAALLAEGRLELSVGEIAASAGVARSTVYAAFGSRAGLLSALADDTLQRAGLDAVIAEYRQPDAVTALERSLAASCRMYAAEHRVFARLLVLARIDPDAAAPIARSQADRAAGMSDLARRLEAQGGLRAGIIPERAADVLWLLTGFWTFDELFVGRGLAAEACTDVLLEIARATVLAGRSRPEQPTPA